MTLKFSQLAGYNSSSLRVYTATHGFAVGDVLYYTGSAWAKAKADATSTLADGVVSYVVDSNNFVLHMSGYVDGLSGLSAGSTYYLSAATAGAITTTAPSNAQKVLKAISTTAAIVDVDYPAVAGGGSVGASIYAFAAAHG